MLGFRLANVNAALEEGAVFNADAGGADVAGERTLGADIDAVRGRDVAVHLAHIDSQTFLNDHFD